MINIEIARNYLQAGLAVLPADKVRKCPVLSGWKRYQEQLPSDSEVHAWFSNHHNALCIVCGKVSGNLEVIDFDNQGELFPAWSEKIPSDLKEKLVIEKTPSGGYHVAYRCNDEVCGNIKLAQGEREGKLTTLIETRGNGGLILCAPGDGYELIQGDYAQLSVLTVEEREILLNAAWRFDEKPMTGSTAESAPPASAAEEDFSDCSSGSFALRPGDDYDARGDVREILIKHGWTSLGFRGDREDWKRPGKEGNGISATLQNGYFYVFSTNAAPFKANQGYAPHRVYALLEHNGDFTAAANALMEEGYGQSNPILENIDEIVANLTHKKEKKNVFTAAELLRTFTSLNEPVIDGLLRRTEVMNVVAAPKTGKSWFILQLAYSLVKGWDFLGFPCKQCRVMIMDNELHTSTISYRMQKVCQSMSISKEDLDLENLTVNMQRFERHSIPEIVKVAEQIKEQGIDLVIIDALYRALPSDVDENSNGQITQMYNQIDTFAQKSGAAVILVHHTSKGNQSGKGITDVGSGAGAQSRAPDTHLVLRAHQEKNAVVVGCCVRSFPPVDSFCLRKDEHNIWHRADDLSPDDLDGKAELTPTGEKRKKTINDAAMKFFEKLGSMKFPTRKTLFIEELHERLDISAEKARALCEKLLEEKILEVRSGDGGVGQQATKMLYLAPHSKSKINEFIKTNGGTI